MRRTWRPFHTEQLILELSESDTLRLRTIIDPSTADNGLKRSRYTVVAVAVVLLLITGALASLSLFWNQLAAIHG
jgi:hypothetical protein